MTAFLAAALQAQFSLQFVIWTTIGLFWVSVSLSAYMLLFRAYLFLLGRYHASRKALYEPAVEQVLMEAPQEEILAILRPKRWGDRVVVQGVILDSIRHLTGPPFDALRAAADQLGIVEKNRADLYSRNPHKRGRAMEALGVMRCHEAIPDIKDLLLKERMDLKLVALRSLTAMGDPEVLPTFIKVSDSLQPSLMMRLASLMMEFGAPARPRIVELVNRHPDGFHPRALAELLRELAAHIELNP